MNRNYVLLIALLFLISFSAGIFTEILVAPDGPAFLSVPPTFFSGMIHSIKNDVVTVLASMIFASCVILLPAVGLLVIGKLFSLGFSAAYILSSGTDRAFGILLAVLLPRGIFKIPAYIALFLVSVQMAKSVRAHYLHPRGLKTALFPHLRNYLLCFLALTISSLFEAFLLQGVL